MLQAMYSGISAIEAQQTGMDIIGNNIANVNTTAYKAGRVTFQDQLSQTIQGAGAPTSNIGGTNPEQVGLGVRVGSIDTLMSQGGLQSTTRPTDMAIQGNGYFMLGDSTGVSYTRDGSFSLDSNGNLVNASNGSFVLGWKADVNGKVDATQQISPASHLSIPVGGLTAVQATSNVTFAGNLSADAVSTDTYSRSVAVYDSLGEKQTVTLNFQRDATDPTNHTWKWSASGDAAATGSGSIKFDSTGKETTATGTISLSPTNGATTGQTITPDFTGITQIAGSSSASPTTQNGFGPGTLQSFSVDQIRGGDGYFQQWPDARSGPSRPRRLSQPGRLAARRRQHVPHDHQLRAAFRRNRSVFQPGQDQHRVSGAVQRGPVQRVHQHDRDATRVSGEHQNRLHRGSNAQRRDPDEAG